MKRLPTFLFFAGVLSAQYAAVPGTQYPALESILNAKPAMTSGAGAPGGSCTSALDFYTRTSNSHLYLCYPANTWVDITGAAGAGAWGSITGTLASQTDLQTALNAKLGTGGNAVTATALAALPTPCAAGSYPQGILANGNVTGCTPAGAGGGITTMTTGASDPVASCTAPSASNLSLYSQPTTQDLWACVATDTWKKVLSTTNTGTYVATGTAGATPSNPAGGDVTCYYSSVSLTQICLDSSGNVFSAVKTAGARTANQFVTHVPATGIPATAGIVDADLPATITRTIASGTATLGTGAISANTCASTVTVTATGAATTDTINWTPNASISGVTGYGAGAADGLVIYPYPTSGNVNFKVCNATGSSITPGAVTLNWRVPR